VLPNGKLRLPKVGDVPVRWSRPLPSEPSSVTVIKDSAGRYFASFVVRAADDPLPESGVETGIDLGLEHFAVLSDGRKIASPRFLRRAEKKLKRAQRALSRKQKGSRNWDKARVTVARAHARVTDARRDFHHQLSTALIRLRGQPASRAPFGRGNPGLVWLTQTDARSLASQTEPLSYVLNVKLAYPTSAEAFANAQDARYVRGGRPHRRCTYGRASRARTAGW
jgi:hypothetical protein